MSIGQKLSPVLIEIEDTLWEYEAFNGAPPGYTIEGFRATTKIFFSALMDKMWDLQQKENMPMEDRLAMAEKVGNTIKDIIKTYTDIDCHKLYNKKP